MSDSTEKVIRSEKISEALKRMKSLELPENIILKFEQGEEAMLSTPPFGWFLPIDDELREIVDEFEKKYNALVYTVIRSYTDLWKMDSLLFVSDEKDEWEFDNTDIKNGTVLTYTINYTEPDFSEFGSIGVKRTPGGIKRTD